MEQVAALVEKVFLCCDRPDNDVRWDGVVDKATVDFCRSLTLVGDVPPDKRLVVGRESIERFGGNDQITFAQARRSAVGWIVDPGWKPRSAKEGAKEYKLYARLVSIKDWDAMAGGTGKASLYSMPSAMEAIESAPDVLVYSAPGIGPC
ncbi:hypothetical protein SMD20_15405 [Nonomuraea sp. LP-02]|uniref:hypothetical protein n=1 Tax=Nonomuraea sp. LP-02 TaxID=3097960 RepID=UPI002E2EA5BD|nr:hypothetical protein [Nonomuraea sp. LP-02]MED7925640.1 hypothetical protein [Nonomuraea sp. LP-02]